MRSLGRARKAASALEKKAENNRQSIKAAISQLSASSTYHHPPSPPRYKVTMFNSRIHNSIDKTSLSKRSAHACDWRQVTSDTFQTTVNTEALNIFC